MIGNTESNFVHGTEPDGALCQRLEGTTYPHHSKWIVTNTTVGFRKCTHCLGDWRRS